MAGEGAAGDAEMGVGGGELAVGEGPVGGDGGKLAGSGDDVVGGASGVGDAGVVEGGGGQRDDDGGAEAGVGDAGGRVVLVVGQREIAHGDLTGEGHRGGCAQRAGDRDLAERCGELVLEFRREGGEHGLGLGGG